MKNILFATDFTNSTTPALDWVKLFARQYGSIVTVLHVFQPMIPDTTLPVMGDMGAGVAASHDIEEISRQNLTEMVTRLSAEGINCQSEWRTGAVEDEILGAAREYQVDLIITGRSDISTIFDRLAGSAAADVAIDAPCPVLVIPIPHDGVGATRPTQIRSIVYTTQLEFDENHILRQASALAQTFNASLKLMKVDASNQPNVNADDQILRDIRREFGYENIHVDKVESRTVSGGLLEYLEKHDTDLLIMTTRQRGFLDGLLNPSLTERMVLRSPIPLLVFHAKDGY
ncbi:hypothetical protein GCM10023189_26510 [Nibrella saemangeumensis]|uniref:UspA domain-containing protein n=1 Tax=Nibrella saemangeumensis TaxID=1084526 RepID=A0ABP8MVB6_9BACT